MCGCAIDEKEIQKKKIRNKSMMATEAQRLISISLAKIAASRCVRGGVSLHKNLLVATVLQKARYIFMEEAFHMVHGHYVNHQANSQFIQQLRNHHYNNIHQSEHDEDDDNESDGNESPMSVESTPENLSESNESDENFTSDSTCDDTGTTINSRSICKASRVVNRKRRLAECNDSKDSGSVIVCVSESKQMKLSCSASDETDVTSDNSILSRNSQNDDNNTSLDFLANDSAVSRDVDTSSTSELSSSIDRISSLVSIFNFGNFQRTVSTPDLCSHSSVDSGCCSMQQQRQIAMIV